MSIELKQAAQQALLALENSQPHPSNPFTGLTNQDFIDHEETIRQLRAAIQQAEAQQPATGERLMGQVSLPDGSAFAIASFPLPKAHWLYAPREYATGAGEPLELPTPILTHGQREAVVAAIRYAVRGATMCGREQDFDPDAMVQNAVYALCGPYARVSAENTQTSVNLTLSQQPVTGEPVAWLDEMLADTREVFDAGGSETPQVVRDVIEYVKSWVTVHSEKNHPAPAAHPAPSVPATSEPVVSRNPFASRCYTMSESHLSGHRLIVGFEKLEDAQAAHEWVARQGRGDLTHQDMS